MIVRHIILISICLQAGLALQVVQPYRVEASAGDAVLHCSYSTYRTTEEIQLTVYKGLYGEDEVCTSLFNSSHTQGQVQSQGRVSCRAELMPDGVTIILSGLKGNDTDLYRCVLEFLYPPPYLKRSGNGTLIYIPDEPDCPTTAGRTGSELKANSDKTFMLPAVAFAFFIVAIIIIVISIYILTLKNKGKRFVGMAPVPSKKVDCQFGYGNFL